MMDLNFILLGSQIFIDYPWTLPHLLDLNKGYNVFRGL